MPAREVSAVVLAIGSIAPYIHGMRVYLLLICFLPAATALTQSDFDGVKMAVVDEIRASISTTGQAGRYAEVLLPDGTWPDINYRDTSRTGFQHAQHLDRLLGIAEALSDSSSTEFQSPRLAAALRLGLSHWLDEDYVCENWWYNEVFTPDRLVKISLLAEPWLAATTVRSVLPIIERGNLDSPGARPGGDRIKFASTEALRQLLGDNEAGFARAMRVINDELDFATGERGMQRDFSFHHRADRVNNTTSYGRSHADYFARWAAHVAGTRYAFAEEKQRLLIDYYLDGVSRQYVFGAYPDPGVMNRDVTRVHPPGTIDSQTPERLLTVSDYRGEELRNLIALRAGKGTPGSFAKFFWQTEHFVFQRPEFYVSVRMHSARNANMESPYNGEGLKNHYRGDGASMLSITGREYHNLWPVYDWRKIPGTTVAQRPGMPPAEDIKHFGSTDFVGAVTDGKHGAVGYDYLSPHDRTRARKAWFFFDDRYVCLGAGLEAAGPEPLVTTIEQNRLSGGITIGEGGKTLEMITDSATVRSGGWVLHGGVAYLTHDGPGATIVRQNRTGYWTDINKGWDTPKEAVEEGVFGMYLNHGSNPQGGLGGFTLAPTAKRDVTYAYSVLPGATRAQLSEPTGIDILSNTRELQAVSQLGSGLTYLIAYRAGSVTLPSGTEVIVDSPAALMLEESATGELRITAADPSRDLARLHLTVSGVGEVRIDLPTGEWRGSSTSLVVPTH